MKTCWCDLGITSSGLEKDWTLYRLCPWGWVVALCPGDLLFVSKVQAEPTCPLPKWACALVIWMTGHMSRAKWNQIPSCRSVRHSWKVVFRMQKEVTLVWQRSQSPPRWLMWQERGWHGDPWYRLTAAYIGFAFRKQNQALLCVVI